jgi:hypothetical protein
MPVRAATEDWCTPPELVEVVTSIFGGRIDLDPCSNPWSRTAAALEVMPRLWDSGTHDWAPGRRDTVVFGDGIRTAWTGAVYVNPPYGRELDAFMDRSVRAAKGEERASVIMLAPAKTSRRCWQRTVPRASAVCFLDGRVDFELEGGAKSGVWFSSALVLWTRDRELVHRFAWYLDHKHGHVMFGR